MQVHSFSPKSDESSSGRDTSGVALRHPADLAAALQNRKIVGQSRRTRRISAPQKSWERIDPRTNLLLAAAPEAVLKRLHADNGIVPQ